MKEVHEIWQGPAYESSPERHAVLAFSHYDREVRQKCDGALDARKADFTLRLLELVTHGKCEVRFFNDLAKLFGWTGARDRQEFWKRVVFFNYLPMCVDGDEIHRGARKEERAPANARFAEVLSERKPDRLFVFSRKSWALLPPREEETAGRVGLRELGVGGFTYGSYCVGGHRTLACGLRHPTRSDHGELRAGVEAFLAVQR